MKFASPEPRKTLFAFTLTECLVAIGILAILATVLIPMINGAMMSSKNAKCIHRLTGLTQAAFRFSVDHQNNLLPYRMPPVGFWYDHLHEYVGREPGARGRDVAGVRTPVQEWQCPETGRQYHINRVCGWTDGSRSIPQTYLKVGQGCIENLSIFPLPGGLSQTAFFACPSATGSCFEPREAGGTSNFIGWNHQGRSNVAFMDGHVEAIRDPGFQSNAALVNDPQWIDFFGRRR